jgi:hypothetical protein
MYGSETWVLAKRSPQSMESAEMRFLASVKGRTGIDKVSNHDIRSELGIYN